ncbi:MAG: hypothetical protein HZA17_02385 [Nitrospirae bacterium]|nr:hypothetical protein [Nitrospirota bacterium]
MNIVRKKIGKNEYAYLSSREGRRIVHKYLGPAVDPQVSRFISEKEAVSCVPERLKGLFWDTRLSNLHLRKNMRYIIERVLEFGDMRAVLWLQMVYPVRTILDVLAVSRGITDKSRQFWVLWFGAVDA